VLKNPKLSGNLDVCWVSMKREGGLLRIDEEKHAKGTSKTNECKELEGLRGIGEKMVYDAEGQWCRGIMVIFAFR